MNFLSIKFVVFFVALYFSIYFVQKRKRNKHIVLLIASYIFYAFGDLRFLGLLIITSLVMWLLGKKVGETHEKMYIIMGVAFNLIILGICKYFNFFIESFANIIKIEYHALNILLPLGISVYSFQSISYLADVYTDKLNAQPLLETLLYIGFFPQIISGPIVKARDFFPQLSMEHKITKETFFWGSQKLTAGLFKKLVIADRLRVCVDAVYAAPSAYSGFSIILAVLSYSLQIYYDFSGYSDMAIGIAHILGYDLGKNFNLPYLAQNPSDFWSRWHISLSSWFREYVYIPLGGNRKGNLRTYYNLFITMILSGLWHGANWNFIIWGICHAMYSVCHKLFKNITNTSVTQNRANINFAAVLLNFILVSLFWIPFRNSRMSNVFLILKRMFLFESGIHYAYVFTFVFAVMMIIIESIAIYRNNGNDIWKPLDLNKFGSKIIFCVFIFLIILFAYFGNNAFIYAQF